MSSIMNENQDKIITKQNQVNQQTKLNFKRKPIKVKILKELTKLD